jgi:AraC-like DNA-binding protein
MLDTVVDRNAGFAFGETVYPRGGVYGMLRNRYAMLLMLYTGAAEVVFDGVSHPVEQGQTALIHNHGPLEIRYRRGERTHVSWCEASPSTTSPRNQAGRGGIIILQTSPRLLALQATALELGDTTGVALNTFRDTIGQAIFAAFLLDSHDTEVRRTVPPTIEKAERLLKARFREHWDGETLARACGVTRSHLVTGFRRCFDITPSRYLWRLRAAEGRRMLIQTDLSITAIAFECGYKSQFHFSRHIAESFGQSPSHLRASQGYRLPSDHAEDAPEIIF